jgi:hypothetical protein
MSVVRRFRPENRLAKLIATPGGVTIADALQQASVELESIRESCMDALDEKLRLLTLLNAEPTTPARDESMYYISNEVFGEAGVFGLEELSSVAYSLCTMLDAGERAPTRGAIIRVHIEAMRALRHPDMAGDKTARAAVLAGLRGLTARYAQPVDEPLDDELST